ncbi:type II toxin-antitoxin system RelE/ParE family toxin [Psychroflexus montanilacus]|uniref:type II toxin-antitoxin system RelE/ParE family toxin n=1 Tax=Psychroflexus montanilacus TaxID=2873598 RepID=UPI001CC9DD90|nr:type II toxin-antitoxin system RelE/ParE family toxin [Psychroflexus montanilacus]MBZ9652238.1 type II toxin-antitoxin system RelE/ParE family toxin [Psychroflexus montanilacus]
MVRINWTFQAKSDLKNIAEYISKDSKLYAKRQVFKIRNRTDILKSHNYSGRKVPEIQDKSIREIFEGNYRIIYKVVTENRIDILTIHHSARDLRKRKI